MTIVKRGTKGSALTYAEMDENLRDLYEDTTIDRVLSNGDTSTREAKIGGLKIGSTLSDSHSTFPIYGNYIAFKGTSNDNQNGDFCYTYIGERIYGAEPRSSGDSRGETSELLLMKLNDTETAGGGSDRIRHYASNHCFDIKTTTTAPLSSANSIEDAVAVGAATDFRAMTIRQSGNVGIGTTNPTGKLHIDGGTSTTVIIECDDTGRAELSIRGTNQGTGRLFVGQSTGWGGGIEYNGDDDPTTVNAGSDYITLYRKSSSLNQAGEFWTARNQVNSNTWEFTSPITQGASDERLKENITLIPNALEKIDKLRGVTFDWKDDVEEKGFIPYAKHETGVIAQDVQKVIPDAAVPAPFDENYLTVKPEKITPLLIECIKELKAEVQLLKTRVQELENA